MISETKTYLNLPLHGDAEQRDKVHNQNRPEHGHVERIEKGTDDSDHGALAHGVPELKLRQPPNERPKFLVGFGG